MPHLPNLPESRRRALLPLLALALPGAPAAGAQDAKADLRALYRGFPAFFASRVPAGPRAPPPARSAPSPAERAAAQPARATPGP